MILNRVRGIISRTRAPLRQPLTFFSDYKKETEKLNEKQQKSSQEAVSKPKGEGQKSAKVESAKPLAAPSKPATADASKSNPVGSKAPGAPTAEQKAEADNTKDSVNELKEPINKWTQEPVHVSPLIRLSRWVLLVCGIIYGATRRHKLSIREEELREREAEAKVIRDAQLAREKRERAAYEAKALDMLSKPAQHD